MALSQILVAMCLLDFADCAEQSSYGPDSRFCVEAGIRSKHSINCTVHLLLLHHAPYLQALGRYVHDVTMHSFKPDVS